jgi:uncharacterized protein YbjQ (UPF0145 family)
MKLFGSGAAPDPEQQRRIDASTQSIAAGGLPLNAVDRLTEQANRNASGNRFFTSDLSPQELMLTRQCGFEPLGQVMGSCVFQVGWQTLPSGNWFVQSGELAVLSGAQSEARQLAFSRLRQEAKLLGADGVVGVKLTRQGTATQLGMVEYIAIGTAVRRIGAPPRAEHTEPFVSNLNGQDHWKLRQAGMMPVGFVFGNSVWYQYPDWRSQNIMLSWSNGELVSLSQATYTAREIAMSHLEQEAAGLRASGVVGVTFENHIEIVSGQAQANSSNQGGFLMYCTVFGTAIGPDPAATFGPIQISNSLPISK